MFKPIFSATCNSVQFEMRQWYGGATQPLHSAIGDGVHCRSPRRLILRCICPQYLPPLPSHSLHLPPISPPGSSPLYSASVLSLYTNAAEPPHIMPECVRAESLPQQLQVRQPQPAL
jgi:hypothetical protein